MCIGRLIKSDQVTDPNLLVSVQISVMIHRSSQHVCRFYSVDSIMLKVVHMYDKRDVRILNQRLYGR